jgi:phospholipase B1
MIKVAKEFNQKGYDDFAVVAQPGFRDSIVETTPFNFISNVDCFHPSIIAHQAMAKVLWNNMLTPSSKKTTNFDYKAPFVCPTTDTLIYTY